MAEVLKQTRINGSLIDKHKLDTVEYFIRRGWRIGDLSELDAVEVKDIEMGGLLNCADRRRYSSNPRLSLAPAFLGAVHGFVALQGSSFPVKECQKRAVCAVKEVGGVIPADHGDLEHGHLKGCKLVANWLSGQLIWLPAITEDDILLARDEYGLHHQTLKEEEGPQSKGLCLNFEPDSIVVPNGQCYTTEMSYTIKVAELLKVSFKDVLGFAEPIYRSLVHEQRVLYIH